MPEFIDVFAGAGGLSLGLLNAGWTGLFAIEKSSMAFETLKYNLIEREEGPRFQWPDWLPREAISIEELLEKHRNRLEMLQGLPLLAGGPPCQGFSMAGRRRANDERNRLFEKYLDLVDLIKPKMLFIENVMGFATPFKRTERGIGGIEIDQDAFNAAEELRLCLKAMRYKSFLPFSPSLTIIATEFGVPQRRARYINISISEDFLKDKPTINPFETLAKLRIPFLQENGLSDDREITVEEAISDLKKAWGYEPCNEPKMGKFLQGKYGRAETGYQILMRRLLDGTLLEAGQIADSHRFPNHNVNTSEKFQQIIDTCRPGVHLNGLERERLDIGKHCIAYLAKDEACFTLTSLPDDLIHYCEPRILTVREYARIQSFPDWFQFKSQYTTGGNRRQIQVPRYTQTANAVPPLLAEVLGQAIQTVYNTLDYVPESLEEIVMV